MELESSIDLEADEKQYVFRRKPMCVHGNAWQRKWTVKGTFIYWNLKGFAPNKIYAIEIRTG